MRDKYFDSKRVSVDKIVDEIYDVSKVGALSIPEVLKEEGRDELLRGIQTVRPLFKQIPLIQGGVIQDMQLLYVEETPLVKFPSFRRSIQQFRREYTQFYGQLARRAGFSRSRSYSMGIHYYSQGSKGISAHRDYATNINMVSIFVLQGEAPFFVCANKKGDNAVKLEATVGSWILLRTARKEEEQDLRPFHYVSGPIDHDRYSLVVRDDIKVKGEFMQDKLTSKGTSNTDHSY